MRGQARSSKGQKGQLLIMTTLLLVPMVGMLGLVTDFGYMHFVKMSAQTAAESAAQAAIISFHETVGGSNFNCGGSVVCAANPTACTASIVTPNNAIDRGCMYAQSHGFNSAGNQTVTYQSGVSGTPPTASGMGTAAYWVTFRAVQKVPQLFSAIMGNTTGLVAARSTAALVGASDCIYALNPNLAGAVSVGGTASLTSSCGIYVDSSDPCAMQTNGGGVISAPEYDVVGHTCTNPLTPAPNVGAPPVSDPLASLPVPATAVFHCDYWNLNLPNQQSVTLNQGTYCGGINVGNNDVTFTAGNYILVGGGLTTQSANSHISGNNVMFYNTFGKTDHGQQTLSYSPISINANSTVNLTAPTSGAYAGILFYDDRNAPASSDSYGGGSTAVYQGIIYAKTAAITLYGNSSISAQYTMIVADTISLVGTTGINDNYSSLPGGSPIQKVVLVE
jgi:hypothetical protein